MSLSQLATKWQFKFPPHPASVPGSSCTTWGNKNKQNITFVFTLV